MSEYYDIHNNAFKVIQRTLVNENNEESILDELYNIFTSSPAPSEAVLIQKRS